MTTTSDLVLAADAGFLGRVPDPGAFIIGACREAGGLLREALENGDIDQVAAIRLQAEAARAYSAQNRQLPGSALLAATELVRRAERGLGVAIRRGQEAGTIRGRYQGRLAGTGLLSPTDFARQGELSPGGGGQPGIYGLTDGITDEDFEAALKEARAEGNLSRANVARKARARADDDAALGGEWIPEPGHHDITAPAQRRKLIGIWAARGFSSPQIADRLGIQPETIRRVARECGITIAADVTARGTHRPNSTRITRETVHALEGLAMGTELVSPGDLDPAEAKDWAASLAESLRTLNRFARQIKESAQ